ncbi:MAG: GreA/GreB family elongation factor [Omnitrophica WOR_2 bacterium]
MDEIEQTPSPPLDTVQLGMHVQVELVSQGELEQLEFDLVPDRFADFARGYLGEGTPLAQAILGRKPGDVQPYTQGDIQAVKVLAVSTAADLPGAEEYNRLLERRRSAVEEAQRRDAMIFASSYSGKWGDYDPQGIESWDIKKVPPEDGQED